MRQWLLLACKWLGKGMKFLIYVFKLLKKGLSRIITAIIYDDYYVKKEKNGEKFMKWSLAVVLNVRTTEGETSSL